MQVHFLSASIFALALAATAPSSALAEPVLACPEQPVCGHCGADILTLQQEQAAATGQDVQTQPQRASTDYLLRLDGVDGESSDPPPPPPPPQNSAAAQPGVQAPTAGQAALLVPAVQRIREAAASRAQGEDDGVVPEMPICAHCGADSEIGSANGGVWKTTDGGQGAAGDPLMDGVVVLNSEEAATTQQEGAAPGSDVQAQGEGPQADGLLLIRAMFGMTGSAAESAPETARDAEAPTAPTEQPPAQERRRRGFSLSIGGVSLSSDGGVNIAVGDVNGDSQSAGRQHRPVQTTQPSERSSARRR